MARQAHPWFRRSDGWWYVKTGGRQLKLARSRQSKQLALRRWHELTLERANNPAVDSRNHTVATIIDLYLTPNAPIPPGADVSQIYRSTAE